MTAQSFVYWLQGYFELTGDTRASISPMQVDIIKNHLNMVFVHDIDPKLGDAKHQEALQVIHDAEKNQAAPLPDWSGGMIIRC